MKPAFALLMLAWIWYAVGELDYRDQVRKEREHCLAGIELEFDMPAWCGKYEGE